MQVLVFIPIFLARKDKYSVACWFVGKFVGWLDGWSVGLVGWWRLLVWLCGQAF